MRDIDIRTALHNDFLSNFKLDGQSKIVDELKICGGKSIADLAVINGKLHAFEIKGKFDNLDRLNNQIEKYSKVFDFITIVAAKNHIKKIEEIVPFYWGIWQVDSKNGVLIKKELRLAKANLNIDNFSLAQLLWKDEALSIVLKNGTNKVYKNKRKWLIWEYLSKNFTTDELGILVREYIKDRKDWKISKFSK